MPADYLPPAMSVPASSSAAAATSLTDLLAGCRRHEPAAQWALYDRFVGPMMHVAQRYAPSQADAEDALQDAFIKVFQKLPDQRDPAAFPGWVRRIVVSTAIDAWHKRRLRRADFDLDDVQHLAAPHASALDQLAVAEIKHLIDKLPAGCRLVMLLYTVEGYSHPEIATLLGISESGSKAHLTRARQRLTHLVAAAHRELRPAPPAHLPTVVAPEVPAAPFHPLTTLLFQ